MSSAVTHVGRLPRNTVKLIQLILFLRWLDWRHFKGEGSDLPTRWYQVPDWIANGSRFSVNPPVLVRQTGYAVSAVYQPPVMGFPVSGRVSHIHQRLFRIALEDPLQVPTEPPLPLCSSVIQKQRCSQQQDRKLQRYRCAQN